MKKPSEMNNSELLDKMARYRVIAFFSVMAVFITMIVIVTYKLHFLYLIIVAIPFLFFARKFYRCYHEVQRRQLG